MVFLADNSCAHSPVQGPAAKAGRAVSDNTPFVCGAVGGEVGRNVPISSKEIHVVRPKQETVLQKHKRWLAELQKTKEKLEQQYLDEIAKKEEAKTKVCLCILLCVGHTTVS